MSDNQLPEEWDEVTQPTSFDDLDLAAFWLADASPVDDATSDDAMYISNVGAILSNTATGREVQGVDIFIGNNAPEDYGYAQAVPQNEPTTVERPHSCAHCPATYRRLGDLTRHQNEKHTTAKSKFLCPVDLCPNGIEGNGFDRKYRLVDHLKSKKHGMDAKKAAFEATVHNLPRGKDGGRGGAIGEAVL